MSYIVLHLEKAKGNDAAMSAHIERTVHPKNADKMRNHLNQELILYPKGVQNRTAAIQHRIDHAGIKRKIGSNQVRAIRIMLSGTHETMKAIEENGKLDHWCNDNLNWLKETIGEDNLVSAVLHRDEKTPHIHATIVPIVSGERRKAKKENTVTGQYKKKSLNTNRLCADDVMARNRLKHYQNTYAVAMQKYGLRRGIEGSKAKHISTSEYYRELHNKNELLKQEHYQKQSELKALEKNISTKKVIENVTNVLTGSKTKRLEQENELMKKEIQAITMLKDREKTEIQQTVAKLERTIEQQDKTFDKLAKYFPVIKDSPPIIIECEKLGIPQEFIRDLLEKKEICVRGEIYSPRHFTHFKVENLRLSIAHHSEVNTKELKINGTKSNEWLEDRCKEGLRSKSQSYDNDIQQQRRLKR